MNRILVKIIVNAVAIWAASALLSGVAVGNANDSLERKLVTLAVVGAIFGLINAVIKPIVKMLSLPLYFLTLGLFALIVNALMLELVDFVVTNFLTKPYGIVFTSEPFFFTTILAALIVTVVSMVLSALVPGDND